MTCSGRGLGRCCGLKSRGGGAPGSMECRGQGPGRSCGSKLRGGGAPGSAACGGRGPERSCGSKPRGGGVPGSTTFRGRGLGRYRGLPWRRTRASLQVVVVGVASHRAPCPGTRRSPRASSSELRARMQLRVVVAGATSRHALCPEDQMSPPGRRCQGRKLSGSPHAPPTRGWANAECRDAAARVRRGAPRRCRCWAWSPAPSLAGPGFLCGPGTRTEGVAPDALLSLCACPWWNRREFPAWGPHTSRSNQHADRHAFLP